MKKEIIFYLIFAAHLATCVYSHAQNDTKNVVLTEKDAGATVNLRENQNLEIKLRANPTTGYSWNIKAIDAEILQPIGKKEHKPQSDRIGGGGHTIFRFKAIAKGKTILRIAYYRVWVKRKPPEKLFTVHLTVE